MSVRVDFFCGVYGGEWCVERVGGEGVGVVVETEADDGMVYGC